MDMKNQPNKATVKDGFPTARGTFKKVLEDLGFANHKPSQMTNSDYWLCTTTAMKSYSDQQNAHLLEKIAQLEESYAKFAKERDEQYGEYIDLNVSLRNENAELRQRVKELEAKIASYESAIDGLKKVVDSLYNLK